MPSIFVDSFELEPKHLKTVATCAKHLQVSVHNINVGTSGVKQKEKELVNSVEIPNDRIAVLRTEQKSKKMELVDMRVEWDFTEKILASMSAELDGTRNIPNAESNEFDPLKKHARLQEDRLQQTVRHLTRS